MIYIPTLTSRLRYNDIQEDYVLYSPNRNLQKVVLGNKITIWDNYTFYLHERLKHNKIQTALEHYLWLIEFINNNYVEGVTLITPDVDWLPNEISDIVEKEWSLHCYNYPQLYVPDTWNSDTSKLNIVGHALREYQTNVHPKWTHCLGHKRELDNVELLTYDKFIP